MGFPHAITLYVALVTDKSVRKQIKLNIFILLGCRSWYVLA